MAAKIVEKETFVKAFDTASQSGKAIVDKDNHRIGFEGSPWEFEFRAKAGYVIHNADGQQRARMICPGLEFEAFAGLVPQKRKPSATADITPNGETSDEQKDDISPNGETSGDGKSKGGSSSKRK